MYRCKQCGKDVRSREPACPVCGWHPPPLPSRDKKVVFKYALPKKDRNKARALKRLYHGHFKTPYCLKVVGGTLYTGSWDKTAASWDLETQQMVRLFQGHTEALYCVDVAEDAHFTEAFKGEEARYSDVLYTGSADTTVRAWVAMTGRVLTVFKGHTSTIWCIKLGDEGKYLFTGSYDTTARMWDVKTGASLRVFVGHNSAVQSVCLAGDLLFTSAGEHTRSLYDREHTKLHRPEPAGSGIGVPSVHDGSSRPPSAAGGLIVDQDGGTGGATIRQTLWGGGDEHTVRVSSTSLHHHGDPFVCSFRGHTDSIMCVQACEGLSRYGTAVAFTGSMDATARSWDVASGRCLQRFVGHAKAVSCLQVVGTTLCTGSWDHTACIWQIDEAADSGASTSAAGSATDGVLTTPLRRLEGHSRLIRKLEIVAISDLPVLFTASYDQTVRMWDFTAVRHDEELLAIYEGHRDVIWDMTVHAGVLYTASADLDLMGVPVLSTLMLHSRAEVRNAGVAFALKGAQDALAHGTLPLAFDEASLRALLVILCSPEATEEERTRANDAVTALSEAMFTRNNEKFEMQDGVVTKLTDKTIADRLAVIERDQASRTLQRIVRGVLQRMKPLPTPRVPTPRTPTPRTPSPTPSERERTEKLARLEQEATEARDKRVALAREQSKHTNVRKMKNYTRQHIRVQKKEDDKAVMMSGSDSDDASSSNSESDVGDLLEMPQPAISVVKDKKNTIRVEGEDIVPLRLEFPNGEQKSSMLMVSSILKFENDMAKEDMEIEEIEARRAALIKAREERRAAARRARLGSLGGQREEELRKQRELESKENEMLKELEALRQERRKSRQVDSELAAQEEKAKQKAKLEALHEKHASCRNLLTNSMLGNLTDAVSETLDDGVDPLAALEALGDTRPGVAVQQANDANEDTDASGGEDEYQGSEEDFDADDAEVAIIVQGGAMFKADQLSSNAAGSGRSLSQAGPSGDGAIGVEAISHHFRRRKLVPEGNPMFRNAPTSKNQWKGLHRGLPWMRWLNDAVLEHPVRRMELGGVQAKFCASGLEYMSCFLTLHTCQEYMPEREVWRSDVVTVNSSTVTHWDEMKVSAKNLLGDDIETDRKLVLRVWKELEEWETLAIAENETASELQASIDLLNAADAQDSDSDNDGARVEIVCFIEVTVKQLSQTLGHHLREDQKHPTNYERKQAIGLGQMDEHGRPTRPALEQAGVLEPLFKLQTVTMDEDDDQEPPPLVFPSATNPCARSEQELLKQAAQMGQNPPALRFSWSHVEDVLHEVLPGDSDTDDDEMTPEDDADEAKEREAGAKRPLLLMPDGRRVRRVATRIVDKHPTAELQLFGLNFVSDDGTTYFEEYLHYNIFSQDNPVTPPQTPPPSPPPPPTPTPPPTPPPPTPSPPPTPREPKPTAMLPPVIVCELQFTEVPALLFGLSAMTSLNLSSNFIEELPSELGNLDVLTHLDLSRNRLSELPDQMGGCTALTDLNLCGNKLRKIPFSVNRFQQLVELDLSYNRLEHVEEEVGHLTKLKKLDLSDNYSAIFDMGQLVQRLPPQLGILRSNLIDLRLENNDIHFPPEAMCNKGGVEGTKQVLEFLHDRIVCRGTLFTGAGDCIARAWDMREIGRNIRGEQGPAEESVVFEGHSEMITSAQAISQLPWPSKTNKHLKRDLLFTGSRDGTARAWDTDNGEMVRAYCGHLDVLSALHVVKECGTMVTASWDGTVVSWNVTNGEKQRVFDGYGNMLSCVALHEGVVYAGGCRNTVSAWHADTGKKIYAFAGGHSNDVCCLAVAGGYLYTGSEDYTLSKWCLISTRVEVKFRGHTNTVRCCQVAWSRAWDAHVLFSGSYDGTARLWDIDDGTCLARFEGHTNWICDLEFSNGILYTCSRDCTVRAWDAFTGRPVRIFKGSHLATGDDTYAIYAVAVINTDEDSPLFHDEFGNPEHQPTNQLDQLGM